MNANSTYIRVLASALSNEYGVTVKEGETWAFNMEKRVLVYNPITLLERPIEVVRGLLIHEIGHIVHTQMVPSSDIYKKYPIINIIYNAFEDLRIEEKMKRQYGQYAAYSLAKKNILYTGDFFEENALKSQGKAFQVGSIAMMVDIMMQIMADEIRAEDYEEKTLFNKMVKVERDLEQYVDPDVHEAAQVIQKKEDWRQLIKSAKYTQSFGDIQKMVDKKIFPYIEELLKQDPQNEQMKQQMEAVGEAGEGEEGETESSQSGDKDMAGVQYSEELDKPGRGNRSTKHYPKQMPPYNLTSALMSPQTTFLASRIKDIMKENASIKFHGNRKSGKLLSRNITRLALGEDNVFSKRNQIDSPKYHLYLAIDGSGSMGGEKEYNAYLGTVIAFDTFKKIRMPMTIVQFGDEVIELVDNNMMSQRFLNYHSQGGGTEDNAMIIHAANYMAKRPDEHFLFIVMGDGCGERLDKNKLEIIKSRSIPMAIGIGAGSNSVVDQYPGGVLANDVTEVPNIILKTLHGYIHR